MQIDAELHVAAIGSPGLNTEHESWRSVRHAVLTALTTSRLIAIVGHAGFGKTALLDEVARLLREGGVETVLLPRGEPGLAAPGNEVVLLDEADSVAPAELQAICARASRCVMAGLPHLAAELDRIGLTAAILRLDAMGEADSARFAREHLRRSGAPVQNLSNAAARDLFRHAAGVPQDLKYLTGLASFAAAVDDAAHIGPAHVASAVRLRHGDDDAAPEPVLPACAEASDPPLPEEVPPPSRARPAARRLWLLPAGAALCVGLAAAWHWTNDRAPTPPAQPIRLAAAPLPAEIPTPAPPPPPAAPPPAAPPPAPPIDAAAELNARWWRMDAVVTLALSSVVADAHALAASDMARADATVVIRAPRAAPALASAATIHVVVTYPTGDAAQSQQADALAARLDSLGFSAEARAARGAAAASGLRYFYAQDAPGAQSVARALSVEARLAPRLTHRSAPADLPLPGAIEIGTAAR